MSTVKFSVVRDEGEVYRLEITGQLTHYRPGQLSGPPERCYQTEADVTITSITLDGQPWCGELTSEEEDEAISRLVNAAIQDAEDDLASAMADIAEGRGC